MTSKKHEVDTPNLWFPARLAPEAILIRYSKRGRALEITALTTESEGFAGGQTFRITLYDFLRGLGVDDEEIRRDDLARWLDERKAAEQYVPMVRAAEEARQKDQQP